MLAVAFGFVCVIVCVLGGYILYIQKQLREIDRQLVKRLEKDSYQLIHVGLVNPHLSKLAETINRSLAREKNLKAEGVRKEREFREQFANISHDLRTPLTIIKGYQQLILNGELSSAQLEKLETSQRHVEELGNLIDRFFEYSCLVNLDIEMHPEPLNLTALVTETLADAVALFEKHGLSVRYEPQKPVTACCDREAMLRILQNLIRNGIVYSAGDVLVDVREGNCGVLTFENPVENPNAVNPDRLFERFYTGDRERKSSTGLGLSIVRYLAEQNRGKAYASMHGGNLRITVELPLAKPHKQNSMGI